MILETKCAVTKNKLQENKGNPKKFWRQINGEILGKNEKNGIEVIKDLDGNVITGLLAAEYANRHYAAMGRDEYNNQTDWTEDTIHMEPVDHEFSFKFIELLEVHQLVQGIDIYKA